MLNITKYSERFILSTPKLLFLLPRPTSVSISGKWVWRGPSYHSSPHSLTRTKPVSECCLWILAQPFSSVNIVIPQNGWATWAWAVHCAAGSWTSWVKGDNIVECLHHIYNTNTVIKFTDNITVVGQLTSNNEIASRKGNVTSSALVCQKADLFSAGIHEMIFLCVFCVHFMDTKEVLCYSCMFVEVNIVNSMCAYMNYFHFAAMCV